MKPYYYLKVSQFLQPKRYENLEDAERDSLKWANDDPGTTVEILQCVGITSTPKASTFWMDGVIPPHVCCFNRGLDDVCIVCGKDV